MMKKLKNLLILLLAIATILVMVACAPTPCDVHVDADDDSKCDVCGEYICSHDDFTGDEVCDLCGAEMEHKTCKDENGDKKCDKCGKCTTHTDDNADEVCDVCDEELPHLTCKDESGDGKCDKCSKCLTHKDANADEKCDNCEIPLGHTKDEALDGVCDVCGKEIDVITIAEALEIASKLESKVETTERYYIKATIKSVTNSLYGALILTDDTGTISVYGTYSVDGALKYSELTEKPGKDDEVLLYCTLQNFDGSFEVRNARLISFVDFEVDLTKYESMDISTAREAEKGKLITLDGVVAKILYANGQIPAGFILVDEGASIYVYSGDVAGAVKEGNKITIAATKDYWILDSEVSAANKHGYKGCNQLTDAYLVENDGKTDNEFDKSWITDITVKELLETPVTENITTLLYKSVALIVKDVQPGFTNYYIYDLDGTTGTYVYTQCNGADFAWLDEFDGKICEVYYTALNAKSQNAYCSFRLQPVSVEVSDYKIADEDVPEFVYEYYVKSQFKSVYTGNPNKILTCVVSSELLGFEDVIIDYAPLGVVDIVVSGPDVFLVCDENGTGSVMVIVTYKGNKYETTIDITVEKPTVADSITIKEAVTMENGTEVTIRGIVVGSTINQPGGSTYSTPRDL